VPWRRRPLETGDLALAGKEAGKGKDGEDRRAEILSGLAESPAIYHCVTRVAGGHRCLGVAEKEKFIETLRRYEAFCMVRVLTFCVMSNHVHVLVEVPEAPEDRGKSWSDEKFLAHLSKLYYGDVMAEYRWKLNNFREKGLDGAAEEFRDGFFARMWDLSHFMKGVNQVFAQWFNRRHNRKGHLWGDRFKSVIVEGGRAARVISAYVDLNPVRAGIVEDPKDYRWSGYGQAVAGVKRAREGLAWTVFESTGLEEALDEKGAAARASDWKEAARRYRTILFEEGEKTERDERKNRGGISPERVKEALEKGGRLSEAEMLRCRVRHFTDGLVVGGAGFVEGVFEMTRDYFGRKRRSGPRRMAGVDTGLRTMRNLHKDALESSS